MDRCTIFFLLKVVWFAAWLGVVLLGIDVGLGVGVVMALVVVLYKSSRFLSSCFKEAFQVKYRTFLKLQIITDLVH